MNLPKIHKRERVHQEADLSFNKRIGEVFKKNEVRYDESITIFSQCIVNLTSDKKVMISKVHEIIETILEDIAGNYNLTYGEKAIMLASIMQTHAKYVIRFERHGNLSGAGGLE